ncbi:cytochrome c oxidase subunit 5b-1, mitochondrial-like [Phoenix dactylifera]|uniref:Cytochrome c oxidase subunit 5b-1, mitochondrial-like n=1 Tax=Phoenix dactylifera TaxID=42345 RepID=A0A8B7MWB2_PHODC|nr:cytochrome c oxidase subunit 5b-1, mitochondrial-like [Phoenix dactylifera]XP_008809641.1 cytochrome c oxidase subunit 5b-1, mitochondrial-like [Phoenix dactylifera]XP_017701259.1 cytochrome c oxidase subunit 5b-1, mitochondrial-like [Phoenix dactylifera]
MWRRASSHLQTLAAPWRRSVPQLLRRSAQDTLQSRALASITTSPFRKTSLLLTSESDNVPTKKRVEDVMPIATGHEREELEAELEGGKQFVGMDTPVGPFGTKEAPAVIKSYYNKRIVGCPGGEGEDEHDVVWFWLEKDKPHECPVCSQYFVLEVIGEGGDPEAHSDDEHH